MNEWDQWKAEQLEKRIQPKADISQKHEPEWTSLTVADYEPQLTALSQCVFRPGSYEKRFVRDVSGMARDQVLSARMVALIDNLYHRYRRQIPNHKQLCKVCKQ